MRFFDFVSVKLTLSLMLGILIGYALEPRIELSLILLTISVLLLFLVWKTQKRTNSPVFGIVVICTTLLLGIFVFSFTIPKNQLRHYKKKLRAKNALHLKIIEVLKSNDYSNRYFATVTEVDAARTTGDVILYVPKDSTSKLLSVDSELITYASVDSIAPPLNPYQFDFKSYLKNQGVYGQLRISQHQFIEKKRSLKTLRGIALNFRETLIQNLQKQGFGNNELGVIQALLLGQRNEISEETFADYRNAGAVHILAVSGLHVGILLFMLQFLLQPLTKLPKGKTIQLITIVTLLWAYAFIAGLSPSIVRAVTMFSFLAYALYLNRPTNTFNVLAWSLFFILLVKPIFIFQVGFQMSYAAVFSIVWVYPKLQRFWYPKSWLVRKGWQLLSVSVAAQLGVLPISLFYFHQFPALFFVSNILVVPFLGTILGLGIAVIGLSYFDILPKFLVVIYDGLIQAMNTIIAWVAQQEAFLFTDITFDSIQLVLSYAIILALVMTFSRFNFKNLTGLLIALIIFSGYVVIRQWSIQHKEQLWIMHQTRNSVVLHQKGHELQLFTHHLDLVKDRFKAYTIAENIKATAYDSLQNHYTFYKKRLLIIDSSSFYGTVKRPDFVLLSQSPKIHLERFLDSIQPKMIIADGSNFKSYVHIWKKTCEKRKLPFHYTGEKGAYQYVTTN